MTRQKIASASTGVRSSRGRGRGESTPKQKKAVVRGGPTDTSRPASTSAWIIRTLPCPARTKDKAGRYRADASKPPVLKLVGYHTRGSRPDGPRLKEYEAWKKHVRAAPPFPALLWKPTPSHPARVDGWCDFATGPHADLENVRKGSVDAPFPGGDKWVFGYHHPLSSAAPYVLVEISEGDPL